MISGLHVVMLMGDSCDAVRPFNSVGDRRTWASFVWPDIN